MCQQNRILNNTAQQGRMMMVRSDHVRHYGLNAVTVFPCSLQSRVLSCKVVLRSSLDRYLLSAINKAAHEQGVSM